MVHGQFREEPPQASSHIIRVESNLVIVPLHVSKKGTAVTGLGPEAFEVFEDGRRQEIAFVEGPGTQDERTLNRGSVPKEIIFLIDVSLSVSRWRLLDDETIREAILDALTEDFRVSIYGFGTTIRHYAGPTRDPALLARALRQLSMSREGRSRVYESVLHTILHAVERGGNARRRLLVFSDGLDTTRFDPDRAVQAALSSATSINPVVVTSPEQISSTTLGPQASRTGSPGLSQRKAALRATEYRAHAGHFHDLGRRTRGQRHHIELMDRASLLRITKSLSESARTEYLVGYYPRGVDEETTTHAVRVRLTDKKTGKLRGGRRLVAH